MVRAIALLLAAAAPAAALDLEAMRASVVKLMVVSQDEDYARPWQRPRQNASNGSAFYIGDRMLMTNAHVVSDVKDLLVKRGDQSRRFPARVLYVGHDCDLAVITVDDEAFWEGMQPLEFGPQPALQTKVVAAGYPMGGEKLSFTEGVVSRVEIHGYSHSRGDEHLAIQIDAAINPGNSGGPVLQDGKVVGVAFQGQLFSQNIGYMIPPSVIRHFLEDIADSRYHGYPELGIYHAKLENDALREWLGVPEGETGVVVLKPMPAASAEGHLKRNDVIHAIDGIPIHDDGTIEVDGELLALEFVVENKHVGDSVALTVRRDGELVELDIPLRAWGARMKPSIQYDERPEYLVTGGYVFVPMTTNYLMRTRGTEELVYYFQQFYRTIADEDEPREQLVLLSQVLPHRSTAYREYQNAIVASVNGTPPRDFRHFVELVEGAETAKIDFEGVNVPPLILDREAIAAVHDEILKVYNIPEDRHVAEAK